VGIDLIDMILPVATMRSRSTPKENWLIRTLPMFTTDHVTTERLGIDFLEAELGHVLGDRWCPGVIPSHHRRIVCTGGRRQPARTANL
jgi:hypothetical protein